MKGIDILKNHIGQNITDDWRTLNDFIDEEAINGDIRLDVRTTSWCAGTINVCERIVGNPGTGSLLALSFLKYGESTTDKDDNYQAQEGDIVVFQWPNEEGTGHGHVTYFVSFNDSNNTVRCLGGNQEHSVKYSDYSQDYILDIRRFVKN